MCDESALFLSVIVPVYNSKTFIYQCFESFYLQDVSLDSYEVIIVDDGSDNGVERIVDDLASTHKNVKVIHKINGGVSSARNEGLRHARGKYVWFIDADDFIAPNIFGKLSIIANTQNFDRIKVESYTFFDALSFDDIDEMCSKGLLKSNAPYKQVFATRTLYRREYLLTNNIAFVECVHYGEDGVFNYQTLIHNPQTYNSGILAYFYRRHPDSVTMAPVEKRSKAIIAGTIYIFDVLVTDYNDKICIEQTRRMLLYWMFGMLENYSLLGYEYFCENYKWDYKLLDIPLLDFELRNMQKRMTQISKRRDFAEVNKLVAKKQKKNNRRQYMKIFKKRFVGYMKHPKRFFYDTINYCSGKYLR